MSKKADRVYGLAPLGKPKSLLLRSTSADPAVYTLPGGLVRDGETEEEAMIRLMSEQTGYDEIIVIRSIGPRHRFADGTDATAYEIEILGGQPWPDEVWVNRLSFPTLRLDSESAVQQMIADGLSVMEPWTSCEHKVPEEFLPIEGIFTDPGVDHLLVEEVSDERREWPRLTPDILRGTTAK